MTEIGKTLIHNLEGQDCRNIVEISQGSIFIIDEVKDENGCWVEADIILIQINQVDKLITLLQQAKKKLCQSS